ncbi:MAG: hypothetical protein HeimC3_49750 [Candidatus Heimdallarchaeota archaeon LC_3]|nr:MAG: hypothetical protein HeimC3_49750 [Candidatus Heimdallarchaeota archaeon LC_3]
MATSYNFLLITLNDYRSKFFLSFMLLLFLIGFVSDIPFLLLYILFISIIITYIGDLITDYLVKNIFKQKIASELVDNAFLGLYGKSILEESRNYIYLILSLILSLAVITFRKIPNVPLGDYCDVTNFQFSCLDIYRNLTYLVVVFFVVVTIIILIYKLISYFYYLSDTVENLGIYEIFLRQNISSFRISTSLTDTNQLRKSILDNTEKYYTSRNHQSFNFYFRIEFDKNVPSLIDNFFTQIETIDYKRNSSFMNSIRDIKQNIAFFDNLRVDLISTIYNQKIQLLKENMQVLSDFVTQYDLLFEIRSKLREEIPKRSKFNRNMLLDPNKSISSGGNLGLEFFNIDYNWSSNLKIIELLIKIFRNKVEFSNVHFNMILRDKEFYFYSILLPREICGDEECHFPIEDFIFHIFNEYVHLKQSNLFEEKQMDIYNKIKSLVQHAPTASDYWKEFLGNSRKIIKEIAENEQIFIEISKINEKMKSIEQLLNNLNSLH